MIGLILSGLWKRLIEALGAVFSFVRTHPWPSAVIVLCALSLWLWHGKNKAADQRDAWHKAWTLQKRASDLAAKAQRELNAKIQKTYQETADEAQERHDARSDRVRDLTGDFILARRLQPGSCPSGRSDPAPAASGAEVPPEPASSAVMVAVRDVETCASDFTYARSAYDWAKSLIDASLAEPAK